MRKFKHEFINQAFIYNSVYIIYMIYLLIYLLFDFHFMNLKKTVERAT